MFEPLQKQPFSEKIFGPRIHLELTDPRHSSEVWSYIQRDHAAEGSLYRWITSEDDVVKYITNKADLNPAEVDYLIFKQDQAIGSFHVHTINYSDHKAEIGYAIEKNQEGHGYVSEAATLIEQEMKRLGFNKLVITCDSDNIRSIRVAERNGFKKEGLLVQDCLENGKFRDSIIFGKLLRQ